MTDELELEEFLLARIAEDEDAARYAANGGSARWSAGEACAWDVGAGRTAIMTYSESAHIARHDPARVLARCAADRRIVEEYQANYPGGYGDGLWHAMACLALPYADHPDYDQTWRP